MDAADGTSIVLGSTTVGLLIKEFFAWRRSRNQKTEITPSPFPVTAHKEPKYVTVQEFNKHVEDNARDHENIFARLNRNDMLTSEINGKLTGIKEDLTLIKQKLFRSK